MASSTARTSLLLVVALVAAVLCAPAAEAAKYPPVAKGLSFDFYKKSCPKAESIVKDFLRKAIQKDVGLAAALIRLHFHDCFVQGCDGSILLSKTPAGDSEQEAPPNLTLRPSAFKAINDLRALLHKACGLVVSCADIVTLAARDSVHLAGGPEYKVPLGRRDSLKFATRDEVLDALPPPTSHVPALLDALAKINLDVNDLVALSGGHTVGIAHCTSFDERQQDEMLPEGFLRSDDVPVIDGRFSSTTDAFNSNTSYPESEDTTESIEVSGVLRAQDEFEQSMLDASLDEQEKSEGLVSHPELDTKGLLHMKDKHRTVEEDGSEFNKSISTITKEEREASDAKHEHGINTTIVISRHALCLLTLRCMLTVYNFLHTSQKAAAY